MSLPVSARTSRQKAKRPFMMAAARRYGPDLGLSLPSQIIRSRSVPCFSVLVDPRCQVDNRDCPVMAGPPLVDGT